jgi:hypothetical protein
MPVPEYPFWRTCLVAKYFAIQGEPRGCAGPNTDGTYGWAATPDVRTKWMQVPKVAAYPEFLWEQPDNEIDGRVAGRKAVSSSQMPAGSVIFRPMVGRHDCQLGWR